MDRYSLQFDWRPYADLDQFALMARQDRNLGNPDRWFQCFRGGLLGLKARLKGVEVHYEAVHSWGVVSLTNQIMIEYHISAMFFNMESAFECLIYTLNSLGFAVDKAMFVDIADEKKLFEVRPANIIGKKAMRGYDRYFPNTKSYILDNKKLLKIIKDHHEISKHRHAIFNTGGRCRFDPPTGFFQEHGIEDNEKNRVLHAPYAEIKLMPEPKVPESKRKAMPHKEHDLLEDIGPRFCTFMNELGCKALNDAQIRITPVL